MEKKEINWIMIVSFILNSIVSITALFMTFLSNIPERASNPAIWYSVIILIPILAIFLLVFMFWAIWKEYDKTKTKFDELRLEV